MQSSTQQPSLLSLKTENNQNNLLFNDIICAEYQKNYIVQGNLLWYHFCNVEVDYKRKDSVDKHIKTVRHLNNKNKNNSNSLLQRTLLLFENTLNEREKINKEAL
ncbi:hypothetical protein RhiirB3_458218 [Rhizophagus irregularis]|nr:hypothetical protein RhiirB3_458218 [Rhizophagus irregularis]